MKRITSRRAVILSAFAVACGLALSPRLVSATERAPSPAALETAVFAGGCFWGIQSVFQHVQGVVTATSGYAGGWTERPTYEDVVTGRTGHAESVRVVFDPSKISYEQLLEVFFSVAHDPTELNRQGPDVGTQYRSALFYLSPDQKRTAELYINKLTKARTFKDPIVTQVTVFRNFFVAEGYHQNYAERNPTQPYIMMYDAPKLENLKKRFPGLYSTRAAGHE